MFKLLYVVTHGPNDPCMTFHLAANGAAQVS
jgi:hypothetical protein